MIPVKNRSYKLTLFFSFILLGIIGIQVYWLKTAIDLRNKQFENSAFSALQNIVKKVEEKENACAVENWISKDTTIIKHSEHYGHNEISVFSDESVDFNIDTIEKGIHQQKTTNKSTVILRVGADKKSAKGPRKVIMRQSTTLSDTLNGAVLATNLIKDKIGNMSVLVSKILSNTDSAGLKMISGQEIEALLNGELKQHNIEITPRLVLKGEDKTTFSTTADTATVLKSAIHVNLYPNDLFGRELSLYVDFPGTFTYLAADMKWTILLAVLFTLLMIAVFAYTLINFNKQKKLNEVKTDFINNMTHELKTPIASIQLASDMLYKNASMLNEDQVREMSKTIHDQSIKMNEDVKNVLQHSLMDVGKNETLCKEVDLFELIKNASYAVTLLADARHIKLEVTGPGQVFFTGNEELLARAVINLLDNAIKYSPEHSVVNVELSVHQQKVQIAVKDNGIGIPEGEQNSIFEKFYRVERGDVHNTKGFGLGLSLVKKAAEKHKGKVWVKSEPGKGSCFYLELPLKK